MYLDGWPPTSDIFIIFQHVGCRLYWSDDSYKTANEECGHSGNRWPFSCTGKVNLVYHQSVLCSKSVSFESSSDRSNRESTLPWNLTFWGDQLFSYRSIVYTWFRAVKLLSSFKVYISGSKLRFMSFVKCWWRQPQSHFPQSSTSTVREFSLFIICQQKNVLRKRPTQNCVCIHVNWLTFFDDF